MAFIFATIKWIAAFFVTLPFLHRDKYKNLMLVSEKGNDARDNGYHFFLYVKQHHPEIDAWYVISHNSPDRPRLEAYKEHLVEYLSFHHCLLFWKAHYLVGTHLRAGHTPLPFAIVKYLNKWFHLFRHKKVVNLKHGITKGFQERMSYEDTRYNLLICGAAPEREHFLKEYHYPATVAQYTGFCRFDKLLNNQTKRQILVMPTWRSYLSASNLTNSTFFKTFQSFLNDKRLNSLLDEYNIDLIFYPHHKMQPYVKQFKQGIDSPHVIIADLKHYDVQQLLKDSALMITDYSSVLFDFVYMKKPVLFFQFDSEEFLGKHIPKGYVDESSFGPVLKDTDNLIKELSVYLERGLRLDSSYEALIDSFFPLHDTHNCERVFEAVMNC